MYFFKELWMLIKLLLFSEKPDKNTKAEFVETRCFPPKGFLYLMWCGKLLYRHQNIRAIGCISAAKKRELLHHEQIHIDQAALFGSWIKYYLIYLWNWILGFSFRKKLAYYTNYLEVEAYAKESDLNYVGTADKRFKLKNRRRLFRMHFKNWKTWLKDYFRS